MRQYGRGSFPVLRQQPTEPRNRMIIDPASTYERVALTVSGYVTNGCADNMCGTSEVPQLADPLWATRKSAEVGHERTHAAAKGRGCS
jgi:hypothetical protein